MIVPEQLATKLNPLPSCVLCFGDEPERLQSSIDLIWQEAQHLGYLERQVQVIDTLSDWQSFFFSYQEQSLFSAQRVIQLHLNSKVAVAQSEKLQQLLNTPNPDVLLVIRAGALDKSALESKWVKTIAHIGLIVQSKTLQGKALNDWLINIAHELNMSMTTDAAQWLAHWSEGNLLAAKQNMIRWQLQGITRIDYDLLTCDQQDWARFDVFSLIDAISQFNLPNSVRIFDRLVDEGEDAVLILWSLAREVRLWQTLLFESQQKSWAQITQDHRLWRDKADKLQNRLRRIHPAMLNAWQTALLKIDKMIKGQAHGDPYLALRLMTVALASNQLLTS